MKPGFIRFVLAALQLIVIGFIGNAQVRTKNFRSGVPAALIETGIKGIPDIFIKAPDELAKLLTQGVEFNPNDLSYKFAKTKHVNVDILSKARVIEEGGFVTYITTITAENALSTFFHFNEFFLPKHAMMRIYTEHELTDNITAKENNENKTWATRIYQGNKLTISVKLPASEKNKAVLKIDKAYFGFKQAGGDNFGNPGWSADCNINIRCPLGNNWQNERYSVALIWADEGTFAVAFTGSLIMNTCSTRKPYILTAKHNIDPPQGAEVSPANCQFIFKYWRLSCDDNSEWGEDIVFNGAELRAKYEPTDFALLELIEIPEPSDQLYYSGWDRSAGVPTGPLTVIHHPVGDLMKISQTTGSIQQVAWHGGAFDHWQGIFGVNMGVIQPGSSGAPMYDNNHRIVGQNHGNQITPGCGSVPFSNCACEPSNIPGITKGQITEGGKFSDSWTGGGNSTNQLSYWLDPLGLGNTFTNTTSIYDLQPDPYTAQIQGNANICNINGTAVYTIELPPGAFISSWGQSNSSINVLPISPNSAQVTYINTLNNSATITANVVLTGPCNQGTYPRSKTIRLGGPNCTTRTLFQMVNGSPVQRTGTCIRLTDIRSVYLKGKESKPGLTEYYTNVWVVDPTATNCNPTPCIRWEFVSAAGYSTYITNGPNVEVIIPVSPANGWIRLRCITASDCGTYSADYWFTPQGSTAYCPIWGDPNCPPPMEELVETPKSNTERIFLSPNPTSNQFKVTLSTDVKDAVIREVRIKNKMGIEVYRQVFKNGRKEQIINLFNQPTDIYIVEVFDGKKWLTEKLSLQH